MATKLKQTKKTTVEDTLGIRVKITILEII
jgi:hypothetical protein